MKGGQYIEFPVDLQSIPMFLREKALFFFNNPLTNISKDATTQLELFIAGEMTNQYIYEDDGLTQAYKEGKNLISSIYVSGGEKRKVVIEYEGEYNSKLESYIIHSIHPEKSAYWVELNNKRLTQYLQHEEWNKAEIGWTYNGDQKAVLIKVPYTGKKIELMVCYEKFDLIGMEEENDWSI